MKKRYFSLYQDVENKVADIYIYGDITSWPWLDSDISSYILSKALQELDDEIANINVYINSYGGEVAEGLAIYNALKRHKAKVTTYVDGFACSIASVIFAAGDERIMSDTSLLMVHNAWTWAAGDANDLKKQADDLEKITQASINAYMDVVNITADELKEMMDEETWLNGKEAFEMGFATKLLEAEEKQVVTQRIRRSLLQRVSEPPKIVPVANITFDKEELEDIVQKQMKKLEERIGLESLPQLGSREPQENKTKPLAETLGAFFDVEKEEGI